MRIKKALYSIAVTAALVMTLSSTSFAAVDVAGEKNADGIPMPTTVSIEENVQLPSTKGTNPGVYDVEVYPADSILNVYYSEWHTNMSGNGNQWANGTLGPKTAALYREKGCDSVYVIGNFNTGTRRYYQLLSNGTIIDQGTVSSNTNYEFTATVGMNSNPQYLDYAEWRIKLHNGNVINSSELWGFIYLPEE